jgi:hypothetical protein
VCAAAIEITVRLMDPTDIRTQFLLPGESGVANDCDFDASGIDDIEKQI